MATRKQKGDIKLNQIKFAQHYAENGNATQAYLFAFPGVTYKSARELGSNLLTNVDVVQLIEQYKEELAVKFNITKEKMLKELIETAEMAKANGNLNAYTKLKEMIIKMCGLYAPDKVEHIGNIPVQVIKVTEIKRDEE